MLHAVRDALNKLGRNDRETVAQDLRTVYRAETEVEAKEALPKLWERWGTAHPRVVARWETKVYASLAFLRYPKPIRRYFYTTNLLEHLAKEVKRRTKVARRRRRSSGTWC